VLIASAGLLLAMFLAACGGGGSQNGNAAKIEAAEGQAQSRASIEKTLTDRLGGEDFSVSGGECSIVTVVTGDSVSLYEEDEWTVTAPDGSAAVKVAPTGATPVSECMNAVVSALAWE
jgi:hypothetical protein